jgi:hypothetical protein
MFFAILMTCYVEASGHRDCQTTSLPDPYRTLSACLIDVEKADAGLRRIRSELYEGTCTQEEPL